MSSSTNAKLNLSGQWGAVPRGMTRLLDAAHFKTYCALACFAANDTRQCYPSMRKLTEDTGSNRSTVNQHIKTLCAVGAITKLQTGGYRRDGGNEANTYRINGCEAVLAATGLTEAMLGRIKPADVSWVVKARAGCEVTQRCPSERTSQEELCGRAAAYDLAFPTPEKQVVATEATGVVATEATGVVATEATGVVATEATGVVATEADTTAHITAQLTTHLTAQSVTGYTNSLSEDSYGAEGESVTAHSDSSEPLGSDDVFVPDVSAVKPQTEELVCDPAPPTTTPPAAAPQPVPGEDPFAELNGYEPYVSAQVNQALHYKDRGCALHLFINRGFLDQDSGYDLMRCRPVEVDAAPRWALHLCSLLEIPLTAREVTE